MRAHRILLTTLLNGAVLAPAPNAPAHSGPAGVAVKQETVISLGPDTIAVEYVTELNRAGAFLETLRMDTNGDGRLAPEEQKRYFGELKKALPAALELRINDKEVPLEQIGEVKLSMPFRKLYRYEAPAPAGWIDGATIEFHNDNYLDFPGEITLYIDPANIADVTYNSLWDEQASAARSIALAPGLPPVAQERDVVFRYRRGSGNVDPPEGWTPAGAVGDRSGATEETARNGQAVTAAVMLGGAALLAGAIVILGRARRVGTGQLALTAGVVMVAATGAIGLNYASLPAWTSPAGRPDDVQAAQIFRDLHGGIYRAFDARTESGVYDTLARSLTGEILDDVYNEVYEAMRMRTGGSTKFQVRRVKPISTQILPADDVDASAFRVRYRWRVYGTVTHYTHTHARFNEYEALYLVTRHGGAWRIAGSEVRQHRRLRIGQT